jgi:hypothetical protein
VLPLPGTPLSPASLLMCARQELVLLLPFENSTIVDADEESLVLLLPL